MKGLSKKDRDVLREISIGVPDLEVCRKFGFLPRQLDEVLARAAKRAEADEVADHAAVYYERALRRRAENAASSLAARFNALMDASPDAILVINAATGIIDQVNENAAKMFGYSVEGLVGLSVEELVPAKVRAIHPAYRIGFLTSTRKRQMGYHPPIFAVRADGTEIELAVALTAALSDGEVMVVCTEFARWNLRDERIMEEPARG